MGHIAIKNGAQKHKDETGKNKRRNRDNEDKL